jgi:hypothetical protein
VSISRFMRDNTYQAGKITRVFWSLKSRTAAPDGGVGRTTVRDASAAVSERHRSVTNRGRRVGSENHTAAPFMD